MTDAERLARWMARGDSGISSEAIAYKMCGLEPRRWGYGYPHDPGDFGRCWRLLVVYPEWRKRLGEMSACGPVWAALVARWDEIEALYIVESGSCPETYKLMREIIDGADVEG